MKRKAAILLLTVLMVGCDDHDFNLDENNYFPLAIGNYWELHPPAQNPMNDQVVVKKEITATKLFSGKEYYLMVIKLNLPMEFIQTLFITELMEMVLCIKDSKRER